MKNFNLAQVYEMIIFLCYNIMEVRKSSYL